MHTVSAQHCHTVTHWISCRWRELFSVVKCRVVITRLSTERAWWIDCFPLDQFANSRLFGVSSFFRFHLKQTYFFVYTQFASFGWKAVSQYWFLAYDHRIELQVDLSCLHLNQLLCIGNVSFFDAQTLNNEFHNILRIRSIDSHIIYLSSLVTVIWLPIVWKLDG